MSDSEENNFVISSAEEEEEEEEELVEDYYDDEDEEDEEEEDDDDDYGKSPSKKKSKRSGSDKKSKRTTDKRKKKKKSRDEGSQFFDNAASEASSDEAEGEAEDGWESIQRKIEDRNRRQRMLSESKGKIKSTAMEAEDIEHVAEDIEKRTFERKKIAQSFKHLDSEEKRVLADAALKPTLKDPRLFRLQCVRGNERLVVSQILNKAFECKVQIYNVFYKAEKSGYVFVEADTRDDVKLAFDDIDYLYGLETNLYLIPTDDMIPTLDSGRPTETFARGDIVRVKTGFYRGDIARVHEIISDKEVSAFVVPRVDYAAELEAARREANGEEATIGGSQAGSGSKGDGAGNGGKQGAGKRRRGFGKGGVRPEKCRFNPDLFAELMARDDADGASGIMEHEDGTYKLLNKTYKDGLLLRNFRMTSLKKDGANPTAEELESIMPVVPKESRSGASESADGSSVSGDNGNNGGVKINITPSTFSMGKIAGERGKETMFRKGDCVVGLNGVFKNHRFIVLETGRTQATVKEIGEGSIARSFAVDLSDLEKSFVDGDHVAVVNGERKGATGFVVGTKTKDGVSIVLVKRDGSGDIMREYARDLTQSTGTQTEISELRGIKVHDFVRFGDNTCGVVYGIANDRYSVIDSFGREHSLEHRDIRSSVSVSTRNVNRGTDRNNNDLSVNDDVLVIDGPQRGSRGKILHFNREFAFVMISTIRLHGGVFPIRCYALLLSSAAAAGQTAAPAGSSLRQGGFQQQQRGGAGGGGAPMGFRPRREPPRFRSGTRVLVLKGRSRGKTAVVRSCNGSQVVIETLVDGRRETIHADSLKDTATGMTGGSSGMGGGFMGSMGPSGGFMSSGYGMDDMQGAPGSGSGAPGGYDPYGDMGSTTDGLRTPGYSAGPYTPQQSSPGPVYSPDSGLSMPVSTPSAYTPSASQQVYSPSNDYFSSQVRTPRG